MASYRFRRHPRWSTSEALSRITAAMKRASDRKAEIELLVERLKEEVSQVDALLTHLAGLRDVEETKPKRSRRSAPEMGPPSDVESEPKPEFSSEEGSAMIHRSAGGAASLSRYHLERKMFLGPVGFTGGSTEPCRFDPSVDDDPLADRAAKMLEVPGLLHAMVLAERNQTVIDMAEVSVPEEALGLPQAEAYRDHVFSVGAFFALSDAATSGAFLRKLRTSE